MKTSEFIQALHDQETLDQKLLWFPSFCAQFEDLVVSLRLMENEIFVTQQAIFEMVFCIMINNKISPFTDC